MMSLEFVFRAAFGKFNLGAQAGHCALKFDINEVISLNYAGIEMSSENSHPGRTDAPT
jgi:hypothetical protein